MSDKDLGVPTYIGRTTCGCMVAAMVDDGTMPKEVADALHEFVMSGLSIERVTVGYVRTNHFGCIHKEAAVEQMTLEMTP